MRDVYHIKKTLVVPLVIDAILLTALLMLSFYKKNSGVETVILALLLIPAVLIVVECFNREVAINDKNLTMKKFLRNKVLAWENVTDVGAVTLKNKVYLVLTTTQGFHIISNAYQGFNDIIKGIVNHVEAERVEEPVKALIDQSVRKISDIVSAWVGAVVLAVIIYVKLSLM